MKFKRIGALLLTLIVNCKTKRKEMINIII